MAKTTKPSGKHHKPRTETIGKKGIFEDAPGLKWGIPLVVIIVALLAVLILGLNDGGNTPSGEEGEFLPWESYGDPNIEVVECTQATGNGSKVSFGRISNGFIVTEDASVYRVFILVKNNDDVARKIWVNMSLVNSSGEIVYSYGAEGTHSVIDPGDEQYFRFVYTREELEGHVGDIEDISRILLGLISEVSE